MNKLETDDSGFPTSAEAAERKSGMSRAIRRMHGFFYEPDYVPEPQVIEGDVVSLEERRMTAMATDARETIDALHAVKPIEDISPQP